MVKTTRAVLALVAGTIFIGVGSSALAAEEAAKTQDAAGGSPKTATFKAKRITKSEAEELVRARIRKETPKLGPGFALKLKEVMVDGLWKRLDAQAFIVTGKFHWEPATYLVRDGEVMCLGSQVGMFVTDLDGNKKPELLYTHSFGSGISHNSVCMYSPDLRAPFRATYARLWSNNLMWGLEKIDDRTVFLKARKMRIGQVVLEPDLQKERMRLRVRVADNLPHNVQKHLIMGKECPSVLPRLPREKIAKALGKKVTFDFQAIPFRHVTSFLQVFAGVSITLDPILVHDVADKPVTLKVEKLRVKEVLQLLVKPYGLKMGVRDGQVFLSKPG